MGIPDHLTCLLRNLYAGQEATGRTGHGTIDWFQIGKGFNLYGEYIMRNAGLEEMEFQLSYFKILKNNAGKMLHSIC